MRVWNRALVARLALRDKPWQGDIQVLFERQRRNLEQLLAALDSGANGLAQVASDDDAGERRDDARPGKLLVE